MSNEREEQRGPGPIIAEETGPDSFVFGGAVGGVKREAYASPKIYVASSWRNPGYEDMCQFIRSRGYEVLDWRQADHPMPRWSCADPLFQEAAETQSWSPELSRAALQHPLAKLVFERDMRLIDQADALLLLTPCGRSAHFEAGVAQGRGLPRAVFYETGVEPELMTADMTPLASREQLSVWLAGVGARLYTQKLAARSAAISELRAKVAERPKESPVRDGKSVTVTPRNFSSDALIEALAERGVEVSSKTESYRKSAAFKMLAEARSRLVSATDPKEREALQSYVLWCGEFVSGL